jgi:nickel-dependent lactate racemase
MGFSGGAKTAAIGLSGRETICTNHMMLMHPDSILGNYETNPIRQDMEDIGRLVNSHVALNVVLNTQKEVVRALAGSPIAVIQAGIGVARQVCQTPVKQLYDLVIASPGGAPKDINLYQSQKAIAHSSLIIRDGGVLILVAACPEGSGSAEFEHFMHDVHSYDEVFEKMQHDGFEIGPHKAFQIARDGRRIHILLLSELPDQRVRDFLLQPVSNASEALQRAMQMLPPQFTAAVLPKATNTIPKFSLQ